MVRSAHQSGVVDARPETPGQDVIGELNFSPPAGLPTHLGPSLPVTQQVAQGARHLLDGDDGPAAINVPVSDGDPPEEGSPVECANYDSFRAEGLTDPENSEPPEDS